MWREMRGLLLALLGATMVCCGDQGDEVTSTPSPSNPLFKLKFYINVNYTELIHNYTIPMMITDWWLRFGKVDYPFIFNITMDLALKSPNRSYSFGSFYHTWTDAMLDDTFRIQNLTFELLKWVTSYWKNLEKTDYQALTSDLISTTIPQWNHGKLALIGDRLLRGINETTMKPSVISLAHSISSNKTLVSLAADPNFNISHCKVAAHVLAEIAEKLNGSAPEDYLGAAGKALKSIAESIHGVTVGYNYSFLVTAALKGAARWPYVNGSYNTLLKNFTIVAMMNNWQKQFSDYICKQDSGYCHSGINYTEFHFYTEPPVVTLVTVLDTEFEVSGNLSARDLLTALKYQNSQQNITYNVGNQSFVMWLIDDSGIADHSAVPVAACITSFGNFCLALATLGYFTRKLRQSERYKQIPILDDDDEELS